MSFDWNLKFNPRNSIVGEVAIGANMVTRKLNAYVVMAITEYPLRS